MRSAPHRLRDLPAGHFGPPVLFFPTSLGVNPQVTVMATGLMVGARIASR